MIESKSLTVKDKECLMSYSIESSDSWGIMGNYFYNSILGTVSQELSLQLSSIISQLSTDQFNFKELK